MNAPASSANRLEALALFLLLTVIGLRPLVQETYASEALEMTLAIGDTGGPTPAFTILMDAFIFAACSCWVGGQLIRRRIRIRPTGIETGTAMLAIGAIGSIFVASDKRIALNATVDWLLLPVMATLLIQLLDAPWKSRLTLCVILASSAAFATECLNQVLVTFPDTVEEYEHVHRDQMWTQRGIPLDDPQVLMFEKRLRGNEARGFSAHPNVAGSYLMLCALTAAGFATSKWRSAKAPIRRFGAAATALLAALSLTALWLTQSRGALAATVLAIGIWFIFWRWRRWIDANRTRAWLLGWALAIGAVGAVLGHGIYHGTLPGKSLAYRWDYWQASAAMMQDHPIFGVGAGNFGKHYLRYKTIDAPEEIQNPHNLFIQAATQWGPLALAGLIAILIGVTRKLAHDPPPELQQTKSPNAHMNSSSQLASSRRNTKTNAPLASSTPPGSIHTVPQAFTWLGALGLAIFALRMITFTSDQPAFALIMTVLPATVWFIAFIILATDTNPIGRFANDPLPGLKLTLGCALIGLLIHNQITFALFQPATATTAFALLTLLLARPNDQPNAASDRILASPAMRWAAVAKLTFAAIVLAWCTIPAIRANATLQTARQLRIAGKDAAQMERAYLTAIDQDPWDPTAPAELAAGMGAVRVPIGDDSQRIAQRCAILDRALTVAQEAINRDPEEISHHRKIAGIQMRRFTECESLTAGRDAVAAATQAMHMYPSSPSGQEQLGNVLIQFGEKQIDMQAIADGINHLTEALRLDDQRPHDEVRRYTPAQRKAIEAELTRARELGALLGR